MKIADEILTKLIEKYEDNKKRLVLKLDKDFIQYRNAEYYEREECNSVLNNLKEQNIIDFKWEKGRSGLLIEEVRLNEDNIREIYNILNRVFIGDILQAKIDIIKRYISYISTDWILDYLYYYLNYIRNKRKTKDIFNEDIKFIEDILIALDKIDKIKEPMYIRTFSIKCYSNSKIFEKKYKNRILTIIKNYEPTIKKQKYEISEYEILLQIGIMDKPEMIEFSGNCNIFTPNEILDCSVFVSGTALNCYFIDNIKGIELNNIKTIIFIENRTNYYDYILHKKENELVIFHGGFYSPKKARFFEKINEAIDSNMQVYFWGDIDLGGFKMFVRLKENIIPNLKPLNMGVVEYRKYLNSGLDKDNKYLDLLKELLNNNKYELFYDVIENIILNKKTIEQEIFLI